MRKIILGSIFLFLVSCMAQQRANDRGEITPYVNWGDRVNSIVIVKASTEKKQLSVYDSGMISEFKELNPPSLEVGRKNALSRCEQWKKTQPDADKINCYVFHAYDLKEPERKAAAAARDLDKKSREELIADIRKTCKDFGYKEGTEKFADCLKDLYVKQSTPMIDSGSRALADEMKARRHQDFYDELLGLGQESLKGRSLGEIYGGATPRSGGASTLCNFTNSVMSGSNRICYYRCNTGTKTSNVGAAQQCPLTM